MNKIKELMKLIVEKENITDRILMDNGFTENDIKGFIKNGILKQKYGLYTFRNVSILYEEGLNLLKEQKFQEAKQYFKKCYELNPEEKDYHLRYIQCLTLTNEYKKAFKVLRNFFGNFKENELEYNQYLYLLSLLMEYRDSFKEKIASLDLDQFRSLATNSCEEQIYNLIIAGNFEQARELLNASDVQTSHSASNDLLSTFLYLIVEKRMMDNLTLLAKYGFYDDISNYINSFSKKRTLTDREQCILFLIEKITQKKQKGLRKIGGSDIRNSIKRDRIKEASRFNEKYLGDNRLGKEKDLIAFLLEQIKNKKKPLSFRKRLEKIYTAIKEENYDEVILLLETLSKIRYLNLEESYILILLKKAKEIRMTGKSLKVINRNSNNFYEAITNNDFESAKKLLSNGSINRNYNQIIKKLLDEISDFTLQIDYPLTLESEPEEDNEKIEQAKRALLEIFNTMTAQNAAIRVSHNVSDEEIELSKRVLSEKREANTELARLRIWTIDGDKKIAIVNLVNPKLSDINIEEQISKIFELFNKNEYSKCREAINSLFKNPNYKFGISEQTKQIFKILGICYMKLSHHPKKVVEKYFSVVDAINKLLPQKSPHDTYRQLNAYAYTPLNQIAYTTVFGFDSGIENELRSLETILYDAIELDIPARLVASNYALEYDEIQLICLIQVRDYYIDKNYEAGDLLLQKVENTSKKNTLVSNVIQNLRKYKLHYCKSHAKVKRKKT